MRQRIVQLAGDAQPLLHCPALGGLIAGPFGLCCPLLDLPGAITGTGGVAAIVYGLSNAATSADGTSHWGDSTVIAALTAGAVLLAAFAVIEARSRDALLPVRLLRKRRADLAGSQHS